MAGSRFEYVKLFESHEKLLPGCWAVARLDGRAFTKFAKAHDFQKPNDERALRLSNAAAAKVLEAFDEHLTFAYGQSDEFSFVLRRESALFSRREAKILSTIVSLFSSAYVALWNHFMSVPLLDVPSFDGRIVLYPTTKHLRDYLRWRQADVHINNLFNTTFWALVQQGGKSTQEAEQILKGTLSKDKHDILFSQFGINYNNESEIFRKGSLLTKAHQLTCIQQYDKVSNVICSGLPPGQATFDKTGTLQKGDKIHDGKVATIVAVHDDIMGDEFWLRNPLLLGAPDSEPPRIRK